MRSTAISSRPAGFVLPVQRWSAEAQPGWLSELWRTRRGRLFLVPGDSPLGFRLPLQSLPAIAAVDYPHLVPADPFAAGRRCPIRASPIRSGRTPLRIPSGNDASPPLAPETLVMQRPSVTSSAARRLRHSGAHGAGGRSARRTPVRVHAAGSRH